METSEPQESATETLSDPGAERSQEEITVEVFDFDGHRTQAVDQYQRLQGAYADCARAVYSVLETALEADGVLVHSLEHRAKTIESFGNKAAQPADDDPSQPKYPDPVQNITDLAGVRVITFLLNVVDRVNALVEREFTVLEKINKSGLLQEEEKLGYQSVHYLVRFDAVRCGLPEYARFAGMTTEIQVRTIVQHAWAEIEHDIQYKAVEAIPASIRRRFTALAGLLEIADREFQAISDEDERNRTDTRRLVEAGQLDNVEITPDALQAYLDRKYGSDGRMSEWSYSWTTRLLKRLGFATLREVDECISPYNDDRVSRITSGSRQGQLTRFEDVLLAAMGERYVHNHPYADGDDNWFIRRSAEKLDRLKNAGVNLGSYEPGADADG
jgi:putative GTP pyrophosphokinase